MPAIKLAIVGVGKIAVDQHLPAILSSDDYELVAWASPAGAIAGVPGYSSIGEMLAAHPHIEAVSLCMPPQYRYQAAWAALSAGKHVFLEKPPGATLSEVADLQAYAASKGCTLFASWHSRYASGVQLAKSFLGKHSPQRVHVSWKEDVRQWHPNQEWIWQPGGLGVFDSGINALSIVTEILPTPVYLTMAQLEYPHSRQAPIGADLHFQDAGRLSVHAEFDWRHTGTPCWNISVNTPAGEIRLTDGGARVWIGGKEQPVKESQEYPSLYRRFRMLIQRGESDVDVSPLRHVADAFMLGKAVQVPAFT